MANELITWSSISAGRRGVDVQDARALLRSKLEGELTAQDDAESRKEMALAALRRLNELVEPLNGALQELHPRASIDGTADKFMQNIVRTGDYSGQPEIVFRHQRLSQVTTGPEYAAFVLRFGRTLELSASGELLVWMLIDVGHPRFMGSRSFDWMPQPWRAPVDSVQVEAMLRQAVDEASIQLEVAAAVFAKEAPTNG